LPAGGAGGFALLFSNRWLEQWQKKRRAQEPPPRTGRGRPKPAPTRFYERIFSLRVTLWYLIFQWLSFDQTPRAAVLDLRPSLPE
jgi:hypothetical protein